MGESNLATDPNGDHGLSEDQLEERKLLTKYADIIEKARSEFDEIAIFKAPNGFEGIVIIAAPTNPKTYETYVNKLHDEKNDKAVESRNFALACTVHPAREEAKTMYMKRGAFALKIVARAQELAGADTKELGKD